MNESRHFVRYNCEHPLWVRPMEGNEEYQLAQVQNISVGGAFFVYGGPVNVGQILELSMEVPREYSMLTLRGEVRHIRESDGNFYCGLEFDEVSEMTPTLFSQYIRTTFEHQEVA